MLSPIQRVVLEEFFRGGTRADDFDLTGGTALAGFYLHHRRSDDLDLFTRDTSNLDRRVHEGRLRRALSAAGLAIERAVERGSVVQYNGAQRRALRRGLPGAHAPR